MDGMTVRALRDALRARGMATDGVKATLAARLLESAGGSEAVSYTHLTLPTILLV